MTEGSDSTPKTPSAGRGKAVPEGGVPSHEPLKVWLLSAMAKGGGSLPKAPSARRGKAVAEGGGPIPVIQSVERLPVMVEGGAPFAKPRVWGAARRWPKAVILSPETLSLGVLSAEANGGGFP